MDERNMEKVNCTNRRSYAWFICAVSFWVQFLAMSFYGSFGPMYVEILRVFGEGDAKTAWVASMSFCITYVISPVTYRLAERIGQRKIMLIGSILFGLGLFTSAFATSLRILYVTIGVMVAIGHSLCQGASMFILPHYFGKNYSLPLGIALSGASLGSLALSSFKELIFRKFAFKIGMQILSGSAILLFLCGITFKEDKPKETKATTEERDLDIDDKYPPLSRNKPFYMLLVASFVYHTMYLVTFVHLTRLAGDFGISDTRSALLPGILAIAESFGKIFVGKLLAHFDSYVVTVYQISWLGLAIGSFLCPFATNFVGLVFYSVGWGFCLGNANGACVLVIRHLVGNKSVVRAYSVFLMCFSPAVLAGPPVAGWLREKTSSYKAAFYLSGSTFALASSLLFIVKILDYRQKRQYASRDHYPFEDVQDKDLEQSICIDTHLERRSMLIATHNFSVTNIQVSSDNEKLSFQNGKKSNFGIGDPFESLHYDLERSSDKHHFYVDRETAI